MIKLVCAAALLMVAAGSACAAAGDVVEVRVVVGDRPGPAAADAELPKDAKVLVSIEALTDAGGDVRARCVVDGKEVRLEGRVTAGRDGRRKVRVEFSQRDGGGVREVASKLELAAGEQKVIGGMTGGRGNVRLVVLTIKPGAGPGGGRKDDSL